MKIYVCVSQLHFFNNFECDSQWLKIVIFAIIIETKNYIQRLDITLVFYEYISKKQDIKFLFTT